MTWSELCDDPRFRDFQGQVETNGKGQIILSPAKNRHALFQGRMVRLLSRLMKGGEVFPECAMVTTDGVKVADVAWASDEQVRRLFDVPAWPEAPAIVVEIMSSPNTEDEMLAKGRLYFAMAAEEFWICSELGQVRFYDTHGVQERSNLCPAFPASVHG